MNLVHVDNNMVAEESVAVKIKKEKGEQTRVFLRNHGLIRSDLKIKRTSDYLFIPVIHSSDVLSDFELVTCSFEKTEKRPTSYHELLNLPNDLQEKLPTSFDIIGDIVLIKLPESLQSYESKIGNALLNVQSHVKTVCVMNPVHGEFRRRSVRIIAGEQKTVTTHKEFGLRFQVDVEKTYFSPRLANERMRVSTLIKKNKSVFDMFCGVAPFSVLIATYAHPLRILAIDKNPDAVRLAKQNSMNNHVEDTVTVLKEDAMNTTSFLEKQHMVPDHIIMNLPFSAIDFFPLAVQNVSDKGMIHYYDILKESSFDERIKVLKKKAEKFDARLVQLDVHNIKTYAPHEFYIGIDITVSKN